MKENTHSPPGKLSRALPLAAANPRQRILVAEDDPDIRRLNTELLTVSGYQVDAVEDGADAWEALQQHNYDLLVTDHEMPKVTGFELLQMLYDSSLKLPVIMATGALPEYQLNRHPELNINAVLLKPYTFEDLLDTVKNVLHATTRESQQATPPPNWQGQPSTNGLRF